jgi:hypothetical protein
MKILIVTALCGFYLAAAAGEGSIEYTLRFELSDLSLTFDDGFALPALPDCEPMWNPGSPRLPQRVWRFAIPAGTRAKDVHVTTVSRQEVPGEYVVYPAQTPRPVSVPGTRRFEPGDERIYESSRPWPVCDAVLQGTGEKCGFRIADVFVYPLRWTAAARRLELCTEVSIRIDYEDDGTGPARRSARQLAAAEDALQMLVDNPEDISRFAPGRRGADPQDAEYVVVTSPALAPLFEPLLDWYRELGLTAETRTRDWIVANYPGLDVPERIRNFIIDYHANHGLAYVLLAGDTQVVPCRKGRATVPGYTDDLPADLYYADLQWSWDGDHDGIWGEYGDDTVDFYADVSVGRAPVDDSAQAANFVNKVLGCERMPAPGYLARMLLPYTVLYATPYYSGRNAQDSIAAFLPDDWQRAPFTGMTTTGPIHDSVESGFGLCHVVAHGNSAGLYTMGGNPIYTTATAGSQTNGRKLPVLTSIACYSGNFEYNDCVAEALMNNPNGGSVAVVMNSRYGIAQPPGCGPAEKLDIRFFDCLFRLDSFELGRAHSAAKDYYAADGRAGGIWQWSLYELNLFGDPRMPVWTAEPRLILAEFPRVVNFGPQTLTVRTMVNGMPAAGVRVRASKPGEFDAVGLTGGDGSVALSINPQTTGAFQVVATKQNGIPVRDSGFARQSGACVELFRYAMLDTAPDGNRDGIVNPGETVCLPAWFRNCGNLAAAGAISVLRSPDPAITVLDSAAALGTLNPGDSAQASFRFRAAACTNGYLVTLDNRVSDASDTAWSSRVPILVGTSVLSLAGYRLSDSLPGGNRNLRLDPGETAELVVQLSNHGFGHGYSVAGVLSSTDVRLAVTDSLGGFGLIPRDSFGGNETDRFLVRADSAMPLETVVLCSLLVQAAGEPARRLSLLIPVGEIRPCDPVPDTGGTSHRYYAYDDGDTGYAACPTFDWVELRGNGTDLALDSNDQTVRVTLPFPVRFYGTRYTTISVCSNGWLAAGSTVARNWANRLMPTGAAPGNMIAVNWDNLDPGLSGTVWYRYDTAGRRIIVEWDSVAYHDTLGLCETFEVIIYDSTVTTPTRDNEIVFQYKTANYYGSSSVGIQNNTSLVGVNYLFDSAYHRAAATILAGRAIKFTTFAPSGIFAPNPWTPEPLNPGLLRVRPSIARDRVEFSYALAEPGRLSIFDRAGREVIGLRIADSGMQIADCELRVSSLPSGVYFCRLTSEHTRLSRRLVLVR